MSSHRTAAVSAIHPCIGVLGGLLLSGCPLTDKYYIDPHAGDAVSAGNAAGSAASRAGSNAGVAGSSPASVTDSGGAPQSDLDAGSGGVDYSSGASAGGAAGAGSEDTAGSAGAVTSESCMVETCNGICCADACVDALFDTANCGACGHACPAGRTCSDGTCHGWTAIAATPREIVGREKAAYTAFGTKLFIFGGLDAAGKPLGDGAIYDLTTDSWTLLPASDSMPSARQLATAIWTGRRVFVVGGRDASSLSALPDGARFDVTENTWLPLADLGTGRVAPLGAPGPDYMLVWGGLSAAGIGLTGGERYVYNATTYVGSWTTVNTAVVTPERVTDAAWAYASDSALLHGGRVSGTTKTARGYTFGFANASWTLIATGPSARWGAFATHDGSAYYLWGGRDESGAMSDGYRYAATWSSLAGADAPTARWAPFRRSGWAFAFGGGDIAIIGGMNFAGTVLSDGGRYVRTTDTWTSISAWPSLEAHEYGAAALVGGEIIVWGGRNGSLLTTTGERYFP